MLQRNVSKQVSCDVSVISTALFIGTAIEMFDSVLELQFLEAGEIVCF